jgi:hypothetical protein
MYPNLSVGGMPPDGGGGGYPQMNPGGYPTIQEGTPMQYPGMRALQYSVVFVHTAKLHKLYKLHKHT